MLSHLTHPLRRRLALGATALLAAGVVALDRPEASPAASYVSVSCVADAGISDAFGGWAPHGTTAAGVVNVNNCNSSGLHTELYPASGYQMPFSTGLGWTYSAPANTRIAAFSGTLQGWMRDLAGGGNRGVLTVDAGQAGRLRLFVPGESLYPTGASLSYTGLNDTSVTVTAACDGWEKCTTNTAWLTLSSPRFVLSDTAPPSVGATSGSSKDDDRWVGTEKLAYSATDDGGGIALLRVYVDGVKKTEHGVDPYGDHCRILRGEAGQWVFGWPKPCASGVNDIEALDSTTIEDGRHTVRVAVVDAAQQEATLFLGERLVANNPPVNTAAPAFTDVARSSAPTVGSELAVNDAKWTGPNLSFVRSWQRCDSTGATCVSIPGATALVYRPTAEDVGHRLRFAVTATNVADSVTVLSTTTGLVTAPSSQSETTPKPTNGTNGADGRGVDGSSAIPTPGLASSTTSSTTHVFVGRVAGEPQGIACPGDRATLKLQHIKAGSIALRYGKASSAQLELTCTVSGKPITDAKLQIATKVAGQAAVAADVTTDGAGHATLRIGKGASRGVTIGYKMYSDDPIARATATLKVVVTGKLAITASRKRLHNGQAVRLRGRLAGGLVP
ncbi:MAG TPA: hypothetical protein VNT03_21175, partial [Baekduia sp.]|nr:hypothetical protein [Baekduia sp.]